MKSKNDFLAVLQKAATKQEYITALDDAVKNAGKNAVGDYIRSFNEKIKAELAK